jgi:hypothetical protein
MRMKANKTKIQQITSIAYALAKAGMRPDLAWTDGLREVYPSDKVKSQLQHTCPKWAFSALCHRGLVAGVAGGSCPAAERMRSAGFVLKAKELLLLEPSLARRKPELRQRVFGLPGSPDFRTPNDEIEVLLALIDEGAIRT